MHVLILQTRTSAKLIYFISEWGPWTGECSRTCGVGIITYTRVCVIGNDCEGENTKVAVCGSPQVLCISTATTAVVTEAATTTG